MWCDINVTHVHVKGFYLGGKLSCSLILSPSFPEKSYDKVRYNCALLVGNDYQRKVMIKSKVNVLSVYTRTHTHTHSLYTCACTHTCMCARTHIHMHTHTHTHMHAHPCSLTHEKKMTNPLLVYCFRDTAIFVLFEVEHTVF